MTCCGTTLPWLAHGYTGIAGAGRVRERDRRHALAASSTRLRPGRLADVYDPSVGTTETGGDPDLARKNASSLTDACSASAEAVGTANLDFNRLRLGASHIGRLEAV